MWIAKLSLATECGSIGTATSVRAKSTVLARCTPGACDLCVGVGEQAVKAKQTRQPTAMLRLRMLGIGLFDGCGDDCCYHRCCCCCCCGPYVKACGLRSGGRVECIRDQFLHLRLSLPQERGAIHRNFVRQASHTQMRSRTPRKDWFSACAERLGFAPVACGHQSCQVCNHIGMRGALTGTL